MRFALDGPSIAALIKFGFEVSGLGCHIAQTLVALGDVCLLFGLQLDLLLPFLLLLVCKPFKHGLLLISIHFG